MMASRGSKLFNNTSTGRELMGVWNRRGYVIAELRIQPKLPRG
jgi:hypothetical protein